jgi:hypothetical protein
MKPSYKESRMASLEMLFHFFKALPSDYYMQKEVKLNDTTMQVFKNEAITLKKKLDRNTTGFDYIEVSGMYLCAFDQKLLRIIMQLLQKQEEQLFSATKSDALNKEYILESQVVYSNQVAIHIKDFYKLLHNKANRSSKDITSKLVHSLQRLASTVLSFYTSNQSKILTAPLLVYAKNGDDFIFQLHPCIMTYHYESKNSEKLLKYKQPFYLIDNSEYFSDRSSLEQLIYTKIQYRFASMDSRYTSFTMDLHTLRSELFLPSVSSRTLYNQTSKVKQALINLSKTSSYQIDFTHHSKHITITVSKS